MNAKSKSKQAHTFSPTHWTVIGELCSSVQNNLMTNGFVGVVTDQD